MTRTFQSLLSIALILGIGVPLWWFVIAVAEPPPLAPPRDLGPIPVQVIAVEPREVLVGIDAFVDYYPRATPESGLDLPASARIEDVTADHQRRPAQDRGQPVPAADGGRRGRHAVAGGRVLHAVRR